MQQHKPQLNSVELLQFYNLRVTNCRKAVVELLQKATHAIGQPDLEKRLPQFDRVTLYRTLDTFEQKGIIHALRDIPGTAMYALCEDCTEHHHYDNHIHFECEVCHAVSCLDQVFVPNINLPKGYTLKTVRFLVSGVCNRCQTN